MSASTVAGPSSFKVSPSANGQADAGCHERLSLMVAATLLTYRQLDKAHKRDRRYFIDVTQHLKDEKTVIEKITGKGDGECFVRLNFFGEAQQRVARYYFLDSWAYRWLVIKLELSGWCVEERYDNYADDDECLGNGYIELHLRRSRFWFLGPLLPWLQRGFLGLLRKVGPEGMAPLLLLAFILLISTLWAWLG